MAETANSTRSNIFFKLAMEIKLNKVMRIKMMLTMKFDKFPLQGLLNLNPFANKWFSILKSGLVFELGLMVTGRFCYLQKN